MSDNTVEPKVYKTDGGNTLVVANGGVIKVETGGKIVPNSGTQAAVIAAITATANEQTASYVQTDAQSVADTANANKAAVNAIITALTNAGIIAAS